MDKKLEEWVNVIKRNRTLNSISYKDLVTTLEENIKHVDDDFKPKLVELFWDNDITKFGIGIKHFFLLFNTVNYHIELMRLYRQGVPFSDDKYFKKLDTLYRKNKDFELIPAPPRDYFKKYKSKSEELLNDYNFFTTATTARKKERDMHLLIDELTNLIAMNNYSKDSKYKSSFRTSKKSIEFNDTEDEILIKSLRDGKRYYRITK